MFSESNLTVKEVFDMVQAMYLRFNFSKTARQTILEFVKILSGPHFESLKINQYYMAKYYNQADNKKYTFFCSDCNAAVYGPIKKKGNVERNSSVYRMY